jgi:hypothetical protein
VNNTAATPGAISTSEGWFTKGAYHNGAYYVGVDAENTLFQITLANGDTKPSTSQSVYSNINHGGADASRGGDLLFDSSGNIYVAGVNAAGNSAVFATETLANAENAAGTAWNQHTGLTDFFQLGGLGNGTRLYAAGFVSGTLNQVTNFTNPSGTAPTFTPLTLTSGGGSPSWVDLSDGVLPGPAIVPEPGTWVGGACLVVLACAQAIRRSRKTMKPQG